MRANEAQWLANHKNRGLQDLGILQQECGLAGELVRDGVRDKEPELWNRLMRDELMETHE